MPRIVEKLLLRLLFATTPARAFLGWKLTLTLSLGHSNGEIYGSNQQRWIGWATYTLFDRPEREIEIRQRLNRAVPVRLFPTYARYLAERLATGPDTSTVNAFTVLIGDELASDHACEDVRRKALNMFIERARARGYCAEQELEIAARLAMEDVSEPVRLRAISLLGVGSPGEEEWHRSRLQQAFEITLEVATEADDNLTIRCAAEEVASSELFDEYRSDAYLAYVIIRVCHGSVPQPTLRALHVAPSERLGEIMFASPGLQRKLLSAMQSNVVSTIFHRDELNRLWQVFETRKSLFGVEESGRTH